MLCLLAKPVILHRTRVTNPMGITAGYGRAWRHPKYVLRSISLLFCFFLLSPASWPQSSPLKPPLAPAQPESSKDALGRTTPRGTVLGFIGAARKGNRELAVQYLNTRLRGTAANALVHQLAVVLDRRLPARLNELSDSPEGSLSDPLKPDEDLIGRISTSNGEIAIVLERIQRGKSGRLWLFSANTLKSIPAAYEEVNTPAVEDVLPGFLVYTRIANIPLFEWLALLIGMPLLYLFTTQVSRLLGLLAGSMRRRLRRDATLPNPNLLPGPGRLLLLAFAIRWLLSRVGLPLLARQFWSTASGVIVITACIWILITLANRGERYLLARFRTRNLTGAASILRLVRGVIDALILFAGLLFTLHHLGISPTAALAGLGVGGIAVALAAQKTLENLIGGISLILDQVLRIGDTLKLGDITGTIEDIGLRSTSIRTVDRTLVSVPNGQIASMNLEILSARDKFWFHPLVRLRYDTTPAQIRSIITRAHNLLDEHPFVESASARVRLLCLNTFSLDVDIFAYILVHEWNRFLEIQEDLLLRIMDIVQACGAEVAFPSQTMYLETESADKQARPSSVQAAELQHAGAAKAKSA